MFFMFFMFFIFGGMIPPNPTLRLQTKFEDEELYSNEIFKMRFAKGIIFFIILIQIKYKIHQQIQ